MKRTHRFESRLSDDELRSLREQAESEKVTPSDLVRKRLFWKPVLPAIRSR